jgi:pimeloyl-ACP methyl ester carboxylesterase
MTNQRLLIILLISIIAHSTLTAQPIGKIDSGNIDGVVYRIVFPENWQNKLVMYAHGYSFVGQPPLSKEANWYQRMTPFLERGYAVAASDYRKQGFALAEGVDDTEILRKHFYKKYGKPDTTYMVGHSMGGGITVAMLENYPKAYQGGLALCPLSSRPYLQCRKEYDMYATFNGLFPGVLTRLSDIFDVSKPYTAQDVRQMVVKAKAIRAAIVAKDSLSGVALAKHFDVKFDDLPFSLFFNENVLRDLAQQCQGNPFDNTNTVYSGFLNDLEVNAKAERLAATADPEKVFAKYDRTGNIGKPVVLVHTIYDQLIPPQYGVTNFENMVHKMNKDKFLTVKYTNGQGHCAFTPQQTAKSFDELRQWIKTGQKSKAGFID